MAGAHSADAVLRAQGGGRSELRREFNRKNARILLRPTVFSPYAKRGRFVPQERSAIKIFMWTIKDTARLSSQGERRPYGARMIAAGTQELP